MWPFCIVFVAVAWLGVDVVQTIVVWIVWWIAVWWTVARKEDHCFYCSFLKATVCPVVLCV